MPYNTTCPVIEPDNIYNLDCIHGMKGITAETVNLIVTSPPYWLNKEYEKSTTWNQYTELMQNFFRESHRCLVGGGYIVINFGDYFNSNNRFYKADIPSVQPATLSMYEWGMSLPFDLQATRIWRKQFARMGIPFVCNDHPRNIFDYEHIWTFRKRNGSNKEIVRDRKLSQRGVLGEGWTSKAGLADHPAAFPIELPLWALECYTDPYNLVVDPFLGSGTTILACRQLNRQYIGFEVNLEYYKMALHKISKTQPVHNQETLEPLAK